jgi:hypothetical protein
LIDCLVLTSSGKDDHAAVAVVGMPFVLVSAKDSRRNRDYTVPLKTYFFLDGQNGQIRALLVAGTPQIPFLEWC